jgi:hypothetical protein
MPPYNIRKPPSYWAHAMDSLVRRDAELLKQFYLRSSSFFDDELRLLFERGKGVEDDSEELDFLIDERDDLELFVQENRYFAILRAWSNYERVRDRLISYAAELQWIQPGKFVRKDGTINPHCASEALSELGFTLSNDEKAELKALRDMRHTIMHNAGRVQYVNPSGHEANERMKVTEDQLQAILALSLRVTRRCVTAFAQFASAQSQEDEPAPEDIQASDATRAH